MAKNDLKGTKALLGGSIGTAGVAGIASAAGACGGICAASVLPIGTFLASIGLGALGLWLVKLQIPLFLASILFASIALWKFIKLKKTAESTILGIALGALIIFGGQSVLKNPAIAEATYSGVKMKSVSTELLKERFNNNSDKVRIVSILSPACPVCVEGHDAMKAIFSKHKSDRIYGEMIWLPIVEGDNRAIASDLAVTLKDERVVDGWNDNRQIGNLFQKTLGINNIAWDIYFIYEPGVKWTAEAPPQPTFWMHQLQGVDPAKKFDIDVFSSEVAKLIETNG